MTRRNILQMACILGASAAATRFDRFGLMSAMAQTAPDYRALVCVFLFGGNDSNNLIVPLDTKGYDAYASIRKNLALPSSSLLPVTAATGNASYGLHSKAPELQKLFSDKRLAVLANVGVLVQPTTRDEYRNGQSLVPANLFSHADQQAEWQTGVATGLGATGWAGRAADFVAPMNLPSTFPTVVSVSGNNIFGAGAKTRPTTVIPNAPLGLLGFNDTAAAHARLEAVQQLLSFDTGVTLVQTAKTTLKNGLQDSAAVAKALDGAPALTTAFPATNLGAQMEQIAKLIQVRGELGMNRQIFFASLGGFDTHTAQINTQDNLFTQLSQALSAFFDATLEMGVAGNVTTFTESDFNRTFQPNTNQGSDHAWGGHHLILGGAVLGGDVYGQFPELALGGPDDVSNEGRWIPTTSLDQYGATLASWFGVAPENLGTVFPNLPRFGVRNLGFLA